MARFNPKYGEENVDYFRTPHAKPSVALRRPRRALLKNVAVNTFPCLWPIWAGMALLVITGEVEAWWVVWMALGAALLIGLVVGVIEWRLERKAEEQRAIRAEWSR
jgi:hypothetical protein